MHYPPKPTGKILKYRYIYNIHSDIFHIFVIENKGITIVLISCLLCPILGRFTLHEVCHQTKGNN